MSPADTDVERQRATNLWETLARKIAPLGKVAHFDPQPQRDLDLIGGLAEPKEEILTYACALTNPEVYARWGTAPPTGLLLIGPRESGKTRLAQALALRTGTPFLGVVLPRLVLQLLHLPAAAGPLLEAWTETLAEMPPITVFFREVDFSKVDAILGRAEAPVEQVMDFVLELIDRTIDLEATQVVGSTSHAGDIASVFLEPGRFERVVPVHPVMPDDFVAALKIHVASAEARAGRPLLEAIDWAGIVTRAEGASIGEWVRLLHAVLRSKARRDAAGEKPGLVTAEDVIVEVERREKTAARLPARAGAYL